MPDLETRLARSRTALLDEIEQPPLADVRRRATRIRRRRAAAAGAAALALFGVIGVAARPWQHDTSPTVTATGKPGEPPVYADAGIQITGLWPGAPVHQLDGDIGEVEFTDATHGIASASCDQRCPSLASTGDGGLAWRSVSRPPARDGLPDLVAFPGGRWLLVGATGYWTSATGADWQKVTPPAPSTRAAIGPGELPRRDEPTGKVAVWSHDRGPLGTLADQPQLTVRWVAPAPAGDGAWWVGGVTGAAPVVAVSRDSGRAWKTTPLPPPAGAVSTVAVGVLGAEVYAVAYGENGELRAVYHSTDGGTSFTPTYPGTDQEAVDDAVSGHTAPEFVSGDPVPLLDGRLLLVGPNDGNGSWWLSDDDGRTFSVAPKLPAVGSIRRTYTGYVAYRLFGDVWTAFSADGSTWQKLQVY